MNVDSANRLLFAIIPSGMAAFLLWQALNGLMTGRVWVAPRHLGESSETWAERDFKPFNFWLTIIFDLVVGMFLTAEAAHLFGWINGDPVRFVSTVYRETSKAVGH